MSDYFEKYYTSPMTEGGMGIITGPGVKFHYGSKYLLATQRGGQYVEIYKIQKSGLEMYAGLLTELPPGVTASLRRALVKIDHFTPAQSVSWFKAAMKSGMKPYIHGMTLKKDE